MEEKIVYYYVHKVNKCDEIIFKKIYFGKPLRNKTIPKRVCHHCTIYIFIQSGPVRFAPGIVGQKIVFMCFLFKNPKKFGSNAGNKARNIELITNFVRH